MGSEGFLQILRNGQIEIRSSSVAERNSSKRTPKHSEEGINSTALIKISSNETVTDDLAHQNPSLRCSQNLSKKIANLKDFICAPRQICVIGPGSGEELLVLKKIWPDAKIFFIDRLNMVKADILLTTEAKMLPIDLMSEECLRGPYFDLIFSHHCLEHFSDLELVFKNLKGLVSERSSMIHIIPLDLDENLPLTHTLKRFLTNPRSVTLFDGPLVDLGHCLKADTSIIKTISQYPGLERTSGYFFTEAGILKAFQNKKSVRFLRMLSITLLYNFFRFCFVLLALFYKAQRDITRHQAEVKALIKIPFKIRNFGRWAQNHWNRELIIVSRI